MKKIFTLMAAAALSLSAGAEVIYSWQSEGPDAVTETGGTATAMVDEARVNYKNDIYYTICLSGKKKDYPTSAYVNVALDKPLEEGDVISVTAYRNKNEKGKEVTVEFLFDGKTDNSIASTEQFANINPDGEADPAPSTQTFTVPASAAGCTFFDMTRGTASTNLFITKLEITREGNSEEPGDETLMHWDFTNWSEATVANLKAANADHGNWSDIEKADGTAPTEASKDNCFWQVKAAEGLSADKYVMANGEVIAELEGLVYTNTKDRVLAIAVNYPDPDTNSGFGPYHGPQYLWFNSKQVYWFTIPNVPAGAIIKMGVESHKLTDARGVKLYIGEETLKAPDGSEVAIGKEYQDNEWLVPATAEATNDVKIQSTNGCNIYYITVTGQSGTSAVENIAADENAPVEYYNLQGVRVANPENGLYIKRQGNKAVKVLVK